jgi:hypothetical protein
MRREQIPTSPVTWQWIASRVEFGLGVLDQRAGRGYRTAYQTWGTNAAWAYERGRAWATAAPRSVPLRLPDGRLNLEVQRWMDAIL